MSINLEQMFTTLEERELQQFETHDSIEFMRNELDQRYRRSENSIYWLQLFLNGWWLENEIKKLNKNFSYIEDNHGILGDQKRGNFIPDFKFTSSGTEYTLDTKTYYSLERFNTAGYNNFEGADFIVAFIMNEKQFYMRNRMTNSKQYSLALPMSKLPTDYASQLTKNIILPSIVKMIRFNMPDGTNDDTISERITYSIDEYIVTAGEIR